MSVNDENRIEDTTQLPEFPPGFWGWSREKQIDWIAHNKTRRTLINALLVMAGVDLVERGDDDDPKVRREEYLTEKDLAAIYRMIRDMNRERRS